MAIDMEFETAESSAELRARLDRGDYTEAELAAEGQRSDPFGSPKAGSLAWKIDQAEAVERVMAREVVNEFAKIRGLSNGERRRLLEGKLCRDSAWQIHPDVRALVEALGLTDAEVDELRREISEVLPVFAELAVRERDRSRLPMSQQFPDLQPVMAWCRRDLPFAGVDRKVGEVVNVLDGEWQLGKLAAAIDPQNVAAAFRVLPSCVQAAQEAVAVNAAGGRFQAASPVESAQDRERRLARERKARQRARDRGVDEA
jgi:hypothetical protein